MRTDRSPSKAFDRVLRNMVSPGRQTGHAGTLVHRAGSAPPLLIPISCRKANIQANFMGKPS
nr:D134 [uncultured bacterium]